MSGRCEECGATTEWDTDIGSAICLQCGTLVDPTQSVLTSHLDYVDTSAREYTAWSNVPGGSALRGRNGRVLAGQDKEARHRMNTISMHDFIRTMATRLSNPGITSRAQGVFDQAMTCGRYRWGRRAKLTAGAALAVALRESHKSDSIRDIAYLLDEPPVSVARAFSAVVELLGLKMSTADPAVHLPMLQTHFMSLVNDGPASSVTLPAQLTKVLPTLVPGLSSVLHTARLLSALLERTNTFSHLPTPPTACALLILALEAELGSSLPHAGALAQALGARVGAGKGVVMQRYKQIYDLVEEWIRDVPWLDAHQRKRAKGKDGGGRSKVAKRVVVARGLKDVVQFQEEIWRKRVSGAGRPLLELDTDDKDDDTTADDWDASQSASGASHTSSGPGKDESHARPIKRAKTRHPKTIVDATHFLLNPLSTPALPSPAPFGPASDREPSAPSTDPSLLTHLLTADASSFSHAFRAAPSRLQLLVAARGGADDAHIADEELFGADELEGLLRTPEEAHAVGVAMGWDLEDGADAGGGAARQRGKKRARKGAEEGDGAAADAGGKGKAKAKVAGSKRINMDALARLLDPGADLDVASLAGGSQDDDAGGGDPDCDYGYDYAGLDEGQDGLDEDEDEDEGEGEGEGGPSGSVSTVEGSHDPFGAAYDACTGDGGEVVEEWRPMSPSGGGAAENWYDF
ncbi:hypothetical protein BD413DRAFT_660284 [Trametes elegans]|nr:hypothetical protein BD413DRAFT_660284 [Trametes elegans]